MIFMVIWALGRITLALHRQNKRAEVAAWAEEDWIVMGDFFHELVDDPVMSNGKWKELLPLFRFADENFAKTHPNKKDFIRYADLVKDEISDSPYQEIGSS